MVDGKNCGGKSETEKVKKNKDIDRVICPMSRESQPL